MDQSRQITPLVSVIIPVYNTEAYLREAVGSITKQTLRELEVIAVDDGSRDGSLALLHEMAAADPRIKVLTQPNGGAAVARNTGLDHATGRYVHFMDSDDVLEADALELCVGKCERDGLDFVIFDAVVMSQLAGHDFNYQRTHKLRDRIYTGIELLETLLDTGGYTVQPGLFVVRRAYLDRIGLRFLPVMNEDELFTPLMYLPAQRAGSIARAFFHRRVRPGSIMTSAFSARRMDSYLAMLRAFDAYGEGKDPRTQAMIRRLMSNVLNGLMHNTAIIPRPLRWRLLRTAVTLYPGMARPKNLALLAAPWTIRLKALFKNN